MGQEFRAMLYGAGLVFLTAVCAPAPARRQSAWAAGALLFLLAGALAGWKLAALLGGAVVWQLFLLAGLLLPRRALPGQSLLFLAAFAAAADFGRPLTVFCGGIFGLLAAVCVERRARSADRPPIAGAFRAVAATAVACIVLLGLLKM